MPHNFTCLRTTVECQPTETYAVVYDDKYADDAMQQFARWADCDDLSLDWRQAAVAVQSIRARGIGQQGREGGGMTMDKPVITSLAPWFGGKRTMAADIIAEIGPHGGYWEPFCGSMAILMNKAARATRARK